MSKHDYSYMLTEKDLTKDIYNEIEDVLNAVMSDPVLKRADINKRFYVRTDASSVGHGNALLQPGDDATSLAAMNREINGGPCEFETNIKCSLKLHPIGFSARKCAKNEKYLHSYYSEALGVNFAIQKWRPFLWGKEFTVITDCNALKWLHNYDGDNGAVKRLQFGILGYNFTIAHRPAYLNQDCDALSRLGLDTTLDQHLTGVFSDNDALNKYYQLAAQLSRQNPYPNNQVTPDKLPGFRNRDRMNSVNMLSHHPVVFESDVGSIPSVHNNNDIVRTAYQASHFKWIISGAGSCTFIDYIKENNICFSIPAAVDQNVFTRDMLQSYGQISHIMSTHSQLIAYLKSHSLKQIHGYYCTIPNLPSSSMKKYLSNQIELILYLQQHCKCFLFFVHLHKSMMRKDIDFMTTSLQRNNWTMLKQSIKFTDFGDAIDDDATVLYGVNKFVLDLNHEDNIICAHPPSTDTSISQHILDEYNQIKFSMMCLCPGVDQNVNNNIYIYVGKNKRRMFK